MATATRNRTQNRTRTPQQARQTRERMEQTREQAAAAGREAAATSQQAGRTLRAMAADSFFATLGAGRSMVRTVRSLNRMGVEAPGQMMGMRAQVPEMMRALRDQSRANQRASRERMMEGFERLSSQGRELVGAVRRKRSTQEAAQQMDTARRQVKAARTSVGKAVGETVEAVGEAAGEVGRGQTARRREPQPDYDAMTLEELRPMARELEIEGRSDMNREELVRALKRQRR